MIEKLYKWIIVERYPLPTSRLSHTNWHSCFLKDLNYCHLSANFVCHINFLVINLWNSISGRYRAVRLSVCKWFANWLPAAISSVCSTLISFKHIRQIYSISISEDGTLLCWSSSSLWLRLMSLADFITPASLSPASKSLMHPVAFTLIADAFSFFSWSVLLTSAGSGFFFLALTGYLA